MALTVNVADVERDPISGRKLLNQYEIIGELGRGVHGKVKLGRNVDKGQDVAIKIVDRYSKRRRLGKLGDPEENVKKEVAILKKAIHPNVVSLLEVIDDPAKKKVYLVLEFVQLGEIPWRRKGPRAVVESERRRYLAEIETQRIKRRQSVDRRPRDEVAVGRRFKRAELGAVYLHDLSPHQWSLEHGGGSADEMDEEVVVAGRSGAWSASGMSSPQEGQSDMVTGLATTSSSGWSSPRSSPHAWRLPSQTDLQRYHVHAGDLRHQLASYPASTESLAREPGPSSPASLAHGQASVTAEISTPERDEVLPSLPGSFLSLAASDLGEYDPLEENFSYVPCLSLEQARLAFRDTVLGVEYLHYQGIIHRDIKPANLLWTGEHRVKISDFGVSYLGRPMRDDDRGEDLAESDARPLDEAVELAKTVGTPAFYAPELCYAGDSDGPRPPVTSQIDVWALGVTLYCLVFARLPFFAADEFALFHAIAEDDLHISRRRLRAVHPPSASVPSSPTSSPPSSPRSAIDYRDEHELAYEAIDVDLYDLLRRLLHKDPARRITLREVKRHPFVLQGIEDPVKWIEETDPARQFEGKKIEVSHEDVEKAVVPIGFLARVRSGMRKVGAAIGFGSPRAARRRAQSGAHSSTDGASPETSPSPTPTLKEQRRVSIRGDEILPGLLRHSRDMDHPLSKSVTASPVLSPQDAYFHEEGGLAAALGRPRMSSSPSWGARSPPLVRQISSSGESTTTIRPAPAAHPASPAALTLASLSLSSAAADPADPTEDVKRGEPSTR
ncbi:MAG: hypothetical protein M1826_000738 [Phylliscum demangeonii]|nr:MAG: hypothetical protein M1826_000738 [Phylliscum demangeonii]